MILVHSAGCRALLANGDRTAGSVEASRLGPFDDNRRVKRRQIIGRVRATANLLMLVSAAILDLKPLLDLFRDQAFCRCGCDGVEPSLLRLLRRHHQWRCCSFDRWTAILLDQSLKAHNIRWCRSILTHLADRGQRRILPTTTFSIHHP